MIKQSLRHVVDKMMSLMVETVQYLRIFKKDRLFH